MKKNDVAICAAVAIGKVAEGEGKFKNITKEYWGFLICAGDGTSYYLKESKDNKNRVELSVIDKSAGYTYVIAEFNSLGIDVVTMAKEIAASIIVYENETR